MTYTTKYDILYTTKGMIRMYIIVRIDGVAKRAICTNGKPDWYGTPKLFKTKKAAQEWINDHSYGGMSFKYEIEREEK